MSTKLPALTLLASAVLSACGGGGSAAVAPPAEDPQVVAARNTANNNPMCSTALLGSFYWEVGDRDAARASGSIGFAAPGASTRMAIASASKWIYGAYVVQRVGVRPGDVPFLNFTSGYTEFGTPSCASNDTVQSCLIGRDGQDPATIGRFDYGSGHMQHHAAAVMGLGPAGNAALAAEMRATLGDFGFEYSQPQLAGGVTATPAGYGAFLRQVLRGSLAIASQLGADKVCTNPVTCPSALSTPVPTSESWHYSLGHWVEDDPAFGDGSFSSAGALGFYPWIDRNKTAYGIVARESFGESEAGYHTAQCGRLIRQAWLTGVEVTATTPTP